MTVRQSLVWIILSQGGLVALQFGSSVVLARLLTPYEMGIFAIAAATIGVLAILQAFGLTMFLIRETEMEGHVLTTAFTVNAAVSVLLALAVALMSALGGLLFDDAGVRRVMLVLALVPLVGIFEFLPAANIERNAEFRTIAGVNAARAVVSSTTTVVLAFSGWTYMSLAWGAVAGSATSAILFMLVGSRHVSCRLGLKGWRRILRFGFQQILIQGLNNIAARLAEVALGHMLGLSALGIYGRASNLNGLFFNNVNIVVGRVMLVDFAGIRRRGLSLRDAYLRTVDILTAVLWPCFAGIAILSRPLVDLLYGHAWIGTAAPLSALSVSAVLLVSLTMTWEVFVVCNETARQARFEFVRTGAGLVFFFAACFVSVSAAAASRILEAAVSLVLYRPHVERMTDTRWPDFAPIYGRNAALTAVACGPAFLLMTGYRWSPDTPLPLVGAAMAIGVGGWLVGLRLIGHPLLDEALRLLPSTGVGWRSPLPRAVADPALPSARDGEGLG